MSNQPVDPRVRLAIARWPDPAPRGAVSTFCLEHGISRKTFYELRKRAVLEGPAAVLEPRSRRPRTSPTRITEEVKDQALAVRAALESSGLDHGPISVHDRMVAMGLAASSTVPSTAALARIFRERGVARAEPRKRPRASYRRFVYPAPNACWQLDATEYVLAGGRTCVVFQLQDDHSRLAVASLAAAGETAEAALAVVRKGIAARGVPQRLLTDNGMALNPTRRGNEGQLVTYLKTLGVQAITGKPYKPTTQGKNERFHQTLFRWLDQQPIAADLAELQAQVDAFDLVYNTQRPHQGLPGRVTPQQAWDATPAAEPPRPAPVPPPVRYLDTGQGQRKVSKSGVVRVHAVEYLIGGQHKGTTVTAVWDHTTIRFVDHDGVILIEHPRPAKGIKYVSNGVRPGRQPRPTNLETVTDVLTHELSPKS